MLILLDGRATWGHAIRLKRITDHVCERGCAWMTALTCMLRCVPRQGGGGLNGGFKSSCRGGY